MMSAEGVGLTLTGIGLFVTLIGIAAAGGKAYGTLHQQNEDTRSDMRTFTDENKQGHKEIIESNRIAHEKIYDCLKLMNGTVREHSIEIANLKMRVDKYG